MATPVPPVAIPAGKRAGSTAAIGASTIRAAGPAISVEQERGTRVFNVCNSRHGLVRKMYVGLILALGLVTGIAQLDGA